MKNLEAKFGGGGALGAGGPPTPTGGRLVELPVSYLDIIMIAIVIFVIIMIVIIFIIFFIVVIIILIIFAIIIINRHQ